MPPQHGNSIEMNGNRTHRATTRSPVVDALHRTVRHPNAQIRQNALRMLRIVRTSFTNGFRYMSAIVASEREQVNVGDAKASSEIAVGRLRSDRAATVQGLGLFRPGGSVQSVRFSLTPTRVVHRPTRRVGTVGHVSAALLRPVAGRAASSCRFVERRREGRGDRSTADVVA